MTAETVALPVFDGQAACAEHPDPDVFAAGAGIDQSRKAAVEWCTRCPIRTDCFAYAAANPDIEGVWGGVLFYATDRRSRMVQLIDERTRRGCECCRRPLDHGNARYCSTACRTIARSQRNRIGVTVR